MPTRPFQLLLSEDMYEKFTRYFSGYGRRQTLLRKAVAVFVKVAEEKMKHSNSAGVLEKLVKDAEFEVDDIFMEQ